MREPVTAVPTKASEYHAFLSDCLFSLADSMGETPLIEARKMDKLRELETERDNIAGKLRELKDNVAQSEGFNDESRTKWDELTSQFEKVEAEVTKVRADAERLAKEAALTRNRPTIADHSDDPKTITREERADAIRGYLLAGKAQQRAEYVTAAKKIGFDLSSNELPMRFHRGPAPKNRADIDADLKRAQSVGTNTAGGHLVNPEMIAAFEQSMLAFGGIRTVATVIRTETGADLPVPTSNDTGNSGALVSENVQVTEQDVVLSNITLGAYKFTSKLVRVSHEFLNDAFLNVDSWLGGLLGERIARGQASYFTTGTGTSQPQGYVTGAGDSSVTLATQDVPLYAEMVNILHSLDPAYRTNSTWTFHDDFLKFMRRLLDGNNLPIWNPGMTGGPPSTILDRPYVVNQAMPVATATKVITIGDMSKFWIRDVNDGFGIIRLNERYADYGQVAFLTFMRSDSKVIDAGTDPIKYATNG